MHTFFEKSPLPAAHILMPVYNSDQFIIHSLESVFKQKYENIQLVIINDDSTDATMSVIEDYLGANSKAQEKTFIDSIPDNRGVN